MFISALQISKHELKRLTISTPFLTVVWIWFYERDWTEKPLQKVGEEHEIRICIVPELLKLGGFGFYRMNELMNLFR